MCIPIKTNQLTSTPLSSANFGRLYWGGGSLSGMLKKGIPFNIEKNVRQNVRLTRGRKLAGGGGKLVRFYR